MLRYAVLAGVLAAPAFAQDLLFFHSPSGNIHCMLASGDWAAARCDIASFTPTYTSPPPDCELDWGSSFEIGPLDLRGQLACVGDSVATPDGLVLGYGTSISLAGFTCSSDNTGMTCINPAGHGFTLSNARQKLF